MNQDSIPEDADRDFTASCFIVKNGKVLLLKHDKLGFWLQPGGHIEKNELPHEAAKRETFEETGFEIEFLDKANESYNSDSSFDTPKPFNVNVHKIEDFHWHCDFSFRAKPVNKDEASHGHEHNGLKWFDKKMIRDEDKIPENVVETCLHVLDSNY